MFGLVIFLAHLAKEIRVETMLANVHQDASKTLQRVLAERDPDQTPAEFPEPPPHSAPLMAPSSGFLVWIDEPALLAAAREADALLTITRQPGSSLVAATPVGWCWPTDRHFFDGDTLQQLRASAASAIHTGPERTAAQDVGFGLRQLTDVTTKALSPGINDPTTAIHALGHSSAMLGEMAARDLGPVLLRDDDHKIRVILHRPSFADLLDLAIAQPRRYGATDPAVLTRLYWLLREIAWAATLPDQHRIIAGQLSRLDTTANSQNFDLPPSERNSPCSLTRSPRHSKVTGLSGKVPNNWTEPGCASLFAISS